MVHAWPCARHTSVSVGGKAVSAPGSPVAHCSILAPQNHHQPLCSTGTNGIASSLCMRDFQSWLDVPDTHQPLIQLRMLLTSTFHVWAPCPALQLSVTAMPFLLPSFSLGSKNCISAMLQLDPFDLSLSCGCPDKSEGAQRRWAASSHRSESQSSCLLAPFHLLPLQLCLHLRLRSFLCFPFQLYLLTIRTADPTTQPWMTLSACPRWTLALQPGSPRAALQSLSPLCCVFRNHLSMKALSTGSPPGRSCPQIPLFPISALRQHNRVIQLGLCITRGVILGVSVPCPSHRMMGLPLIVCCFLGL